MIRENLQNCLISDVQSKMRGGTNPSRHTNDSNSTKEFLCSLTAEQHN
jgi:hypothetical protein